jgi:hypothetical protein
MFGQEQSELVITLLSMIKPICDSRNVPQVNTTEPQSTTLDIAHNHAAQTAVCGEIYARTPCNRPMIKRLHQRGIAIDQLI